MNSRKLFALSDPHLSLGSNKPMAVFGPRWDDHMRRLEKNWRGAVGCDDVVLVPGDISWGMRLKEAIPDLTWLADLPGRKILLRGNHDYWWQSIQKLNALRLPNVHFLQNNTVILDGLAIGGSRLWDFPGITWGFIPNAQNRAVSKEKRDAPPSRREEDPERIRTRELGRLETSLASLPADARLRIAMTHFPPIGEDGATTVLTDIIGSYDMDICVFGHVHALIDQPHPGADIVIGKTRYVLAASDYLEHHPIMLAEF